MLQTQKLCRLHVTDDSCMHCRSTAIFSCYKRHSPLLIQYCGGAYLRRKAAAWWTSRDLVLQSTRSARRADSRGHSLSHIRQGWAKPTWPVWTYLPFTPSIEHPTVLLYRKGRFFPSTLCFKTKFHEGFHLDENGLGIWVNVLSVMWQEGVETPPLPVRS